MPVARSQPVWHGRGVRWAPREIVWWTAVLFMIGSFCFAIASVPGVSSIVPAPAVGITYFVGSLFFTAAGLLNTASATMTVVADEHRIGAPVDRIVRSPDWWAAVILTVGTLFFNVNTWRALQEALHAGQELRVWSPDFLGCICFLVSSAISQITVRDTPHGLTAARGTPWAIALLNLVGSFWFMAAAFAAFTRPDQNSMLDASLANTGTLLGAICFLWGARLMLVVLYRSG